MFSSQKLLDLDQKELGKHNGEIYSRLAIVLKEISFCHFLLDMTVGFMKGVQSINVTLCHYK